MNKLDITKIKSVIDRINGIVIEKLKKQNDDTEALGVSLTDEDRESTEFYRYGQCGNVCMIVKEELGDIGASLERCPKEGKHYCLYDQKSDVVIEPTYKQFLYATILDPRTGVFKDGFSEEQKIIIDQMPDIFVGSPEELLSAIRTCLYTIGKPEDLSSVWNNYIFPASVLTYNEDFSGEYDIPYITEDGRKDMDKWIDQVRSDAGKQKDPQKKAALIELAEAFSGVHDLLPVCSNPIQEKELREKSGKSIDEFKNALSETIKKLNMAIANVNNKGPYFFRSEIYSKEKIFLTIITFGIYGLIRGLKEKIEVERNSESILANSHSQEFARYRM